MEKFTSFDQWESAVTSRGFSLTRDKRTGTYFAWSGTEKKGEYVTHSSAGPVGGRLSNLVNAFERGVNRARIDIRNKLSKFGLTLQNYGPIYEGKFGYVFDLGEKYPGAQYLVQYNDGPPSTKKTFWTLREAKEAADKQMKLTNSLQWEYQEGSYEIYSDTKTGKYSLLFKGNKVGEGPTYTSMRKLLDDKKKGKK